MGGGRHGLTRTSFSPPATKQLVLADIRKNPNPDKDARDFAKNDQMNKATQALALIIGNKLSRLLGNFFLGFHKGKYPTKLFTSPEKAKEWLLSKKV